MRFYQGNRTSGAFDMSVEEVARQFVKWYKADADTELMGQRLGRTLLWWLASVDHFDAAFDTSDPQTAADWIALEDLVIEMVFDSRTV